MSREEIQIIFAIINFRESAAQGKEEKNHDSPNSPLYYVLGAGVDPWVPLSPAFHISYYIFAREKNMIYYIIFCYISTIYQLKFCHWVMLFVQHIAKSTSIKFLCVTWAFLLAYNPNTNTNTVRNTNIHLHEVIVRVRWKGIPTCVQPKGRSSRHREVESYVGGLLRWTRCLYFMFFIILIIILYFCYILRRRPPEVDKMYIMNLNL